MNSGIFCIIITEKLQIDIVVQLINHNMRTLLAAAEKEQLGIRVKWDFAIIGSD